MSSREGSEQHSPRPEWPTGFPRVPGTYPRNDPGYPLSLTRKSSAPRGQVLIDSNIGPRLLFRRSAGYFFAQTGMDSPPGSRLPTPKGNNFRGQHVQVVAVHGFIAGILILPTTAFLKDMTEASKDPVLVVLQLTGGNDYLDTVVPCANPLYRDYRCPKSQLLEEEIG